MLMLDYVDPDGVANKVVAKIRKAFEDDLLEEQNKRVNFPHAQMVALGCLAECFFCGARCSGIQRCDGIN